MLGEPRRYLDGRWWIMHTSKIFVQTHGIFFFFFFVENASKTDKNKASNTTSLPFLKSSILPSKQKKKNLQGVRKEKPSLWQINWQQLWAREMVNRSYGQVISMTIYNGYIQDFFSVTFSFFFKRKTTSTKAKVCPPVANPILHPVGSIRWWSRSRELPL